jgi:hypothetical protein
MGNDRVVSAIARIERALARVEAAVSGQPARTLFETSDGHPLQARHQALRGKVEGAISRIDSLIQSAERR